MRQYGGFELDLKEVPMLDEAVEAIKAVIAEISDAECWLEEIEVLKDEKIVSVDPETDIDLYAFENILFEISKAIVMQQPDGAFEGKSQYKSTSGFAAFDIVSYKNKKLEVISIEAETEGIFCPECGEWLYDIDEYRPEKEYICPYCEAAFDAGDAFTDEDPPEYGKKAFVFENNTFIAAN